MKTFFKFFGYALLASITVPLHSVTVENRTPYKINIYFFKKTSDESQQKSPVKLKEVAVTKIYEKKDPINTILHQNITSIGLLSGEEAEIILDKKADADMICVSFNEYFYEQKGWFLVEGEFVYTSPDNRFVVYSKVFIKQQTEI